MDWIKGIASGLGSMLGGDDGDAYKDAAEQMQKYFEMVKQMEMPFINAGTGQLPKLTGAEDALMDPAALEAKWASGYKMSPMATQLQDQAKASGLDAAASQGLIGSSASLNNIQQGASNIMNKDRSNYMNDLMSKYMSGIGIGQNIYNKGAGMAGGFGQQTMNMGEEMGKAAYGEDTANSNQMKDMINMAMRAFMASQGGGF